MTTGSASNIKPYLYHHGGNVPRGRQKQTVARVRKQITAGVNGASVIATKIFQTKGVVARAVDLLLRPCLSVSEIKSQIDKAERMVRVLHINGVNAFLQCNISKVC